VVILGCKVQLPVAWGFGRGGCQILGSWGQHLPVTLPQSHVCSALLVIGFHSHQFLVGVAEAGIKPLAHGGSGIVQVSVGGGSTSALPMP